MNYHKTWLNYVYGFDGESWLGLKILNILTNSAPFGLHVTLEDWAGATFWATYCNFSVGSANDDYRLSISGYDATSTGGDSLGYNNGMAFSTYDQDNDMYDSGACASGFQGGWWYGNCTMASPTGKYYPSVAYATDGITWETVFNNDYSFKVIEMFLRYTACPCP